MSHAADLLAPPLLGALLGPVNRLPAHPPSELERVRRGGIPPLFAAHPALAERVPWRPLGDFPTPVQEVAPDVAGPGAARLFVKREDLSSAIYGGNKVRKLEHFVADAEIRGADGLLTLGAIGSNHALATALHGRSLGFGVDLVLYDQPVNDFVLRNLGAMLSSGAFLSYAGGHGRAFAAAFRLLRTRRKEGRQAPYFIIVGGSSRLGCIGHVNAAFELARQVEAGEVPEPDTVVVPLGTCGTAAGLVAGLRLAGLRTRVMAVRVADPVAANAAVLRYFAQDVADLLHRLDGSIPKLRIGPGDFDLVVDQYGGGYGVATAACEEAIASARPALTLDPTYTGKAFAACLRSCQEAGPGRTVLFWNSYSSAPLPAPASWAGLPRGLEHLHNLVRPVRRTREPDQ